MCTHLDKQTQETLELFLLTTTNNEGSHTKQCTTEWMANNTTQLSQTNNTHQKTQTNASMTDHLATTDEIDETFIEDEETGLRSWALRKRDHQNNIARNVSTGSSRSCDSTESDSSCSPEQLKRKSDAIDQHDELRRNKSALLRDLGMMKRRRYSVQELIATEKRYEKQSFVPAAVFDMLAEVYAHSQGNHCAALSFVNTAATSTTYELLSRAS